MKLHSFPAPLVACIYPGTYLPYYLEPFPPQLGFLPLALAIMPLCTTSMPHAYYLSSRISPPYRSVSMLPLLDLLLPSSIVKPLHRASMCPVIYHLPPCMLLLYYAVPKPFLTDHPLLA